MDKADRRQIRRQPSICINSFVHPSASGADTDVHAAQNPTLKGGDL